MAPPSSVLAQHLCPPSPLVPWGSLIHSFLALKFHKGNDRVWLVSEFPGFGGPWQKVFGAAWEMTVWKYARVCWISCCFSKPANLLHCCQSHLPRNKIWSCDFPAKGKVLAPLLSRSLSQPSFIHSFDLRHYWYVGDTQISSPDLSLVSYIKPPVLHTYWSVMQGPWTRRVRRPFSSSNLLLLLCFPSQSVASSTIQLPKPDIWESPLRDWFRKSTWQPDKWLQMLAFLHSTSVTSSKYLHLPRF